jgi:multisubunit Na+/H+ antiporter MnhG subunit
MSSLPADLIIWALLLVGTVFCGFGLMGLVLFPDTRSRMFTAFRATAIGLGAMALAVITYGYSQLMTTGGDQYLSLILRTILLVIVLAAGAWVIYRIIRTREHGEKPGSASQPPAVFEPVSNQGE